MFSSCMDRSSSGRPGASEPLRVVVCLLSACFAVTEPMNESSAYRALAPSETARTATISQRCSQAGGGERAVAAADGAGRSGGDGIGPGPAGGSGPVDTAELTGVSSVIVPSITEPAEPNSPIPGDPLSSVDQGGTEVRPAFQSAEVAMYQPYPSTDKPVEPDKPR